MIFSWGSAYNTVHISTAQSEFNATGQDSICGCYEPGVIGSMPPKDRPLCARCFALWSMPGGPGDPNK